jgi:DNA-directed RNA polymerase specialized sigma24 family protein
MTTTIHATNGAAEAEEKIALPRLCYSMKEAAEIIGVSYITMHRLLKRGLIKSSSALRTKLIAYTELQRFLKATTT